MEMEWISVKDRLPERMQPVIVCRDNGKVEQGYRCLSRRRRNDDGQRDCKRIQAKAQAVQNV